MPEHTSPAQPDAAVTHTCTCAAHTITRACPIDCLRLILSGSAFHPLARATGAPFDPPATVGAVVDLHRQRQLNQIAGLGPRRLGEIELSLTVAGLTGPDSHDQRTAPAPGGPR